MNPHKTIIPLRHPAVLLIALCFLTAPLGASTTDEPLPAKKSGPREVAARVNGVPIYVDQLTSEVEKSVGKYRKYGLKKTTPKLEYRFRARALETQIANELVIQASSQQKVKDLDAQVDEQLKKIKRKYRDEKGFEFYLKKNRITEKKLVENLRTRARVEAYLKAQGVSEPPIPEIDKQRYYKDNPKLFARKESVKVSHILIKVEEKAAPEEKLQAREKTEKIRREVLGGKDFGEMAKEYSECNSASGGGGLRYINRGYMPEPFEKVAFAMDNGTVSQVVETRFGFHIIMLEDRVDAGVAPFKDVEDFITKALRMDLSKQKKDEHIKMLRSKAKVEILLKEDGAESAG